MIMMKIMWMLQGCSSAHVHIHACMHAYIHSRNKGRTTTTTSATSTASTCSCRCVCVCVCMCVHDTCGRVSIMMKDEIHLAQTSQHKQLEFWPHVMADLPVYYQRGSNVCKAASPELEAAQAASPSNQLMVWFKPTGGFINGRSKPPSWMAHRCNLSYWLPSCHPSSTNPLTSGSSSWPIRHLLCQ